MNSLAVSLSRLRNATFGTHNKTLAKSARQTSSADLEVSLEEGLARHLSRPTQNPTCRRFLNCSGGIEAECIAAVWLQVCLFN